MAHLFERLFGTVAVSEGRIFYRFRWMSRLSFPSSAHLVAAGVSWPCVGMFFFQNPKFLTNPSTNQREEVWPVTVHWKDVRNREFLWFWFYVFATGVITDPWQFAVFAMCHYITCVELAHMVDATQHIGWMGFSASVVVLGFMQVARTGNQNRNDSDYITFASIIRRNLPNKKKKGQSRMTGTLPSDKAWSDLKHVPKCLCSRDNCDSRSNPRMEQYVCSYNGCDSTIETGGSTLAPSARIAEKSSGKHADKVFCSACSWFTS